MSVLNENQLIGASQPSDAAVWYGDRGINAGGWYTNPIYYFNIAASPTVTAASFGTLSTGRATGGDNSVSSGSRGVFGNGRTGGGTYTANMDYITISTTGNATYFGNYGASGFMASACSDSVYGVFTGGHRHETSRKYITIASTGNASSFGSCGSYYGGAACSGSSRGISNAGGANSSDVKTDAIEYITIGTSGSSSSFGDLSSVAIGSTACENATRGVIALGSTSTSPWNFVATMEYITIASTGNATSFGNRAYLTSYPSGTGNGTRGVFGGGWNNSGTQNTLDYITIASTGNASAFGTSFTSSFTSLSGD